MPAAAARLWAPPLAAQELTARQLLLQAAAGAGLADQGAAERRARPHVAALRTGVAATGEQLATGVATDRRGLIALYLCECCLRFKPWTYQ